MNVFDEEGSRFDDQLPTGPVRPTRAGGDQGARAAVRTIRLLAAGLFVALVGTAVFVTSRIVRSDEPRARAARPRPVLNAPVEDGRITEVGPLPGTEIDTYVAERRQDLARAQGERLAVVSLRSYVTEAEAHGGIAGRDVVALLVAAPGGVPTAVKGPLLAWADEQRVRDSTERDELKRLIPTVDDPAFKADYEAEVARLDKAIKAIDPTADVVYGFVVRRPAADLAALANEREVRLVDLAPAGEPADDVVYRGIRPEETTKANAPPTRDLAPETPAR